MNYTKYEIKSGMMIAVCIAIFLFLIFSVGKFRVTAKTYQLKVLFNFISGLEESAPVRFAGTKVGKVEKIEILDSGSEGYIAVGIRVDDRARVKQDSKFIIDTLGMMGEKYIEISPGSKDSPLAKPGDTLRGIDPIAMSEIFDKINNIADETNKTVVVLRSLLADTDDTLKYNRGHIDDIISNLDKSSVYFKAMTRDLRWHPWKLLKKGPERPMTEDGEFKDEKDEEAVKNEEAKDQKEFTAPPKKKEAKLFGIF